MDLSYHLILVSLVIQGSWVLTDKEKTIALLEGDILLTEHQKEILAKALRTNSTIEEVERLNQHVALVRNGTEFGPKSPLQGATTAAFPKWNEGIIPYTINASLGKKERSAIREAIQEWESMTCIRFVKRKDQWNYLEFFKGDGCWGTMGMGEGKSQISIGEGCGYRRVVSHEIGHVVGFFHEHSRIDRDEYVDINWWNIQEDMESSFNKYTGDSIDSRGSQYDYGSIMHYPWHAMSSNGKVTIVPKKTVVNQPYRKLSQLDAAQTNLMYKEICQKGSVKPPLNTLPPPVASTQLLTPVESQQPPLPFKRTTPRIFSAKAATSLKTAPPTIPQTTPKSRKPPLPLGTIMPGTSPPKTSTPLKTSPRTVAQTSQKRQKPPLSRETTTPRILQPETSKTVKTAQPTVTQAPQPLRSTTPYPRTTAETLDCEESKCEDKYKSCGKWKAKGLCEKRKKSMSEVCCKSCKTATASTCNGDTMSSCKSWAKRGYCRKRIVALLCCKSCTSQLDSCKDKSSNCKRLMKYCKVGKFEMYMLRYCCKTCEFHLQKSCRDTSRLCKIYRRRGYCTKKSNVMARRCKATCGFCDRAPMKCKVKKEKENNCRKVSQRPKEGATCNKVVRAGLENHCINDTALSASSEYRSKYVAAKGRLNGRLAWCSAVLDQKQYIIIDLGTVSTVKQIITQGMDGDTPAYISKFYINYSNDKKVWDYSAKNIWGFKIYTGNDDGKHETLNEINPPIIARYIRIHPVAWKAHICLRLELGIC